MLHQREMDSNWKSLTFSGFSHLRSGLVSLSSKLIQNQTWETTTSPQSSSKATRRTRLIAAFYIQTNVVAWTVIGWYIWCSLCIWTNPNGCTSGIAWTKYTWYTSLHWDLALTLGHTTWTLGHFLNPEPAFLLVSRDREGRDAKGVVVLYVSEAHIVPGPVPARKRARGEGFSGPAGRALGTTLSRWQVWYLWIWAKYTAENKDNKRKLNFEFFSFEVAGPGDVSLGVKGFIISSIHFFRLLN